MKTTPRKNHPDLPAGAPHSHPLSPLAPHPAHDPASPPLSARAREVQVVRDTGARRRASMTGIHPDGVFETHFPLDAEIFPYRLEITAGDGYRWTQHDPYAFGTLLTDFDIHLLSEGSHLT